MIEQKNICVLGAGLLGGSIALATRESHRTTLWSRRDETIEQARALGLRASGNMADAVENAELLVLCVPVGAMAQLLEQAVAAGLPRTCLLTDVGSVKRQPHTSLRPVVKRAGMDFIGSHPMAGGEKGGIEQSRADLFQNAACLLTNDENVALDRQQCLEGFWSDLGCKTSWMDAESHDALVARISHFPHVLAAVGSMVSLRDTTLAAFGGGGLRDTTRVASGSPSMWAEILCENREHVIAVLGEAIGEMAIMRDLLANSDQVVVQQWLAEAKTRRDVLNPS
jgi:prephenate dehydrogenase